MSVLTRGSGGVVRVRERHSVQRLTVAHSTISWQRTACDITHLEHLNLRQCFGHLGDATREDGAIRVGGGETREKGGRPGPPRLGGDSGKSSNEVTERAH